MSQSAYKGNPDHPNVNPVRVTSADPTNDTQIYYYLDPDPSAEISTIEGADGSQVPALAGQTITTPKYGRYKAINLTSGTLYAYPYVTDALD